MSEVPPQILWRAKSNIQAFVRLTDDVSISLQYSPVPHVVLDRRTATLADGNGPISAMFRIRPMQELLRHPAQAGSRTRMSGHSYTLRGDD